MEQLPTGTVTFLFSDIEGSTRLVQSLGDAYLPILEEHAAIVRSVLTETDGIEVSTEGDSFFCVFSSALSAVEAAARIQRELQRRSGDKLRVRMGVHTGEGRLGGDNYVGIDVHRAARIGAAGHGGQVLISDTTRSLISGRLPSGVALRQLGRFRLKDLAEALTLHQLEIDGLPHDFPPLRGLVGTPHNLPAPLTSFVPRPHDLEAIQQALAESRLVTLTGPGGTGKTRLGLEAAGGLLDRFIDGIWFVPLAAVTDPDLVMTEIAQALSLHHLGSDPLATVMSHLTDRATLLLLDNFEHLVEAGPVVAKLLQGTRNLRVLVTSRTALRVYGERETPIAPLDVPTDGWDPEQVVTVPAVALFVDRARAVDPSFQLHPENTAAVAEITTRLDGLPLAIELAAARVKLFSPGEILGQLSVSTLGVGARDQPDRQRTLAGTIRWSYDLLDAPGQRLFAILGVFVGGWELAQAQAVAAAYLDIEVAEGVGTLVDHSLVRRHDRRFRMLETIREFARERLAESGSEPAVRHLHAATYLDLVEAAAPHLTGRQQRLWHDRIAADYDNIRAALTWAIVDGDGATAARFAFGLWRFWQIRGYLHEGDHRVSEILRIAPADPVLRLRVLEAAGGISYWRGDMATARERYREAVGISRQLGDPAEIANALYNFAFPLTFDPNRRVGDVDTGLAHLTEALDIFRSLGDDAGVARVLWGRANIGAEIAGDVAGASVDLAESIRLFRELDDPFGLGWALFMDGNLAVLGGELERAETSYREALGLFWEVGDTSGLVLNVTGFAQLAARKGHSERAVRLMGGVARLRQVSGTDLTDPSDVNDPIGEAFARFDEAGRQALLAEGWALTDEALIAYALER